MTEEVKTEGVVNTPNTDNQVTQPTPIELEARNQGWVPQDEWQGDPEKWRPAKEYVDRGELLRRIEGQSKSLKETQQALKQLADMHKKVREVEYQRALNDLKTQKKAAMIEGDLARVAEVDESIDYLKEQQQKVVEDPVIPEITHTPPALAVWEESNKWYKSDRAMTAFANDLAAELRGKGYGLEMALQEIDKQVRLEFPHKFRNPNKPTASAVEGASKPRKSSSDNIELTEEQRRVARKFIQMGAFKNEQEYLDQLKSIS
jgi:hypothetical protein